MVEDKQNRKMRTTRSENFLQHRVWLDGLELFGGKCELSHAEGLCHRTGERRCLTWLHRSSCHHSALCHQVGLSHGAGERRHTHRTQSRRHLVVGPSLFLLTVVGCNSLSVFGAGLLFCNSHPLTSCHFDRLGRNDDVQVSGSSGGHPEVKS
jgi:hypothetical protein